MDPDLLSEEAATSGRTPGDEPDSTLPARVARMGEPAELLVEQADRLAVAVGAKCVDAEVLVVWEAGEPVPVIGVGDQKLDVGVVPGGGVEVVDHALAQVEMFLERRATRRELGVIEVAEDPDPRAHRPQQPVGWPVLLADVHPGPGR